MGILSNHEPDKNNILTEHGFKFKTSNCTGVVQNCYEKYIQLSSLYCAWVAVVPETGFVYIYIEYDCGGLVAEFQNALCKKWEDSQSDFFEELDDYVTSAVSSYQY